MRKTIGRRLTLHRETVRVLAAEDLVHVQGGLEQPKTTAWTQAQYVGNFDGVYQLVAAPC